MELKNFFQLKENINKQKSNAIIYSLYQSNSRPQAEYISMLYYSLKTLYDKSKKINFDIIVFLDSDSNFDFINYIHLKKFRLIQDYPNVIFIQSDYSINKNDGWMAKWYHIEKAFEYNYEKVFYLDVDTRFFGDPNEIFLYERNKVHANFEAIYHATKVVLERQGMNSGTILLDNFCYKKIPNFYNSMVKTRERLNKKSESHWKKGELSEEEHKHFSFFSEQYGPQFTFLEKNIEIETLDYQKINHIPGFWSLDITWKDSGDHLITNAPEIILHYSSSSAHAHLPIEFMTENYINKFQKEILKKL